MNWLDVVIIVAVAAVALAGWRIGGIHAAVTAAGIVVGIVVASRFHDQVNPLFSRFIESDNASEVAAFAAVFGVVLLVAVAAGFGVRLVMQKMMLGWVDKAAGLVLGVVVTFAVGSALFSAIQSYPMGGMEDTISDSTLGTFLADNFDVVLRGLKFVPSDLGA